MFWQRIKCLFGYHDERILGMELPYSQQVLLKCDCCGKYGIWHRGINCEYWTKDMSKIPEVIVKHIKEHNL